MSLQKRVGGFVKSSAAYDLFAGIGVTYLDGAALGNDLQIQTPDMLAGKRTKIRLTGLLIGAFVSPVSLGIGPFTFVATGAQTDGFVFAEIEVFNTGYVLPPAGAPNLYRTQANFIARVVVGDGVVQHVEGTLGTSGPLPLNVTITPIPGTQNTAFFALGELSVREAEE